METQAEFYGQVQEGIVSCLLLSHITHTVHVVGQRVKVSYLVLYNSAQFLGFLFVVLRLLYLLKDGWGEAHVYYRGQEHMRKSM